MKKSICVLVLLSILCLSLFTGCKKDAPYTKEEYVAPVSLITSVHIEEVHSNVNVKYYDGLNFKIEYYENKYDDYTYKVEGSILYFSCYCEHAEKNILNIKKKEYPTTIYVPSLYKGSILIDTTAGNVTVDEMTLIGLSINTTAGNIEVTDLTSDVFTATTTVGNIKLYNAYNLSDVSLSTTAGNMDLLNIDAENIYISATTGNVTASLTGYEADYKISVDKTVGKSNISDTTTGDRRINISVTLGNIDVRFIG